MNIPYIGLNIYELYHKDKRKQINIVWYISNQICENFEMCQIHMYLKSL